MSAAPPANLAAAACAVLNAADPGDKTSLSATFAALWRQGALDIGTAAPPERPARPATPILKPPREMPRRRAAGTLGGRIALLHALAHIELNAIDLAWDLIARFTAVALPRAFYDDWVAVAAEEALHHALVAKRLATLGSFYGALPAHDGLWEAAQATAHDLLARLAIVPLVLEARGLDVTPEMIARLDAAGDGESAAALRIIYRDEIIHVRAGVRWFAYLCEQQRRDPATTYQALVRRHFKGGLKPPFNAEARRAAGFAPHFYEALAVAPPEPQG